ncbi:glycoside hydrolase family 9 protein [Mucilaginibacter terrae]|uniref:glycoside hydrolase family 9 protein n=1 Tax=Mucilaginibacter terrae TaxID=1955052 RepID=UPI003645C4D9
MTKSQSKLTLHTLFTGIGLLMLTSTANAQTTKSKGSDSIRINQIGFYPKAPKTAIVLTDKVEKFTVQDLSKRIVFSGTLKAAPLADMAGNPTFIADFTALTKPGSYIVQVSSVGFSYPFKIEFNTHKQLVAGVMKGFYYQRASISLTTAFAGKWTRPAGHPDDSVLIHPSAATVKRPAGMVIRLPRGWYDAGDYNKYIVNSGISMGTLLSICEDFPEYTKAVKLNIPENNNKVPDILDELLWNLRWMLTMQDPDDGGVYHKLTNASFDGMVMPDKALTPRYVVQKGTAATLDFAAVMAQASRVLKRYNQALPGLSDSCIKASIKAWQWSLKNPNLAYEQKAINAQYSPVILTGEYGDHYFKDEFNWAACELYITTGDDRYLINSTLKTSRFTIPSWAQVSTLGYYSLLRNRNKLSVAGKQYLPALTRQLVVFADSLMMGADQTAYQTVMGKRAKDFGWGSNSGAANQGIALIQAYLLTNDIKYANAALTNLDYLLGRNATGYSYVTGFGSKQIMHPHHRPSVADGVAEPVPGLLTGGPNPGKQDDVDLPSLIPDRAFIDDDRAYAVNEIAINWNAPFAYLVNAFEALQMKCGYSVK